MEGKVDFNEHQGVKEDFEVIVESVNYNLVLEVSIVDSDKSKIWEVY